MNKKVFLIALIPTFMILCCLKDGWKVLDLNVFKISIPNDWNYQKEQGEDSFVGEIKGPKIALSFDYSTMGYASNLIDEDDEDEAKNYHIKIDTTDFYIIKTVYSKISSKGLTGIYIKSRSSSLNFQLSGAGLPKHEQDLALRAFKTIELKQK